MKIWKIIKIFHIIIVKSLDILNIFHIFVIRKGDNHEGRSWKILLRTAQTELWSLAMGLGFGKERKRQICKGLPEQRGGTRVCMGDERLG